MKSAKVARKPRERRQILNFETCESRELMAADSLGVFAVQAGNTATPNSSVSQPFQIDRTNFQAFAHRHSHAESDQRRFSRTGPMSVRTSQNPVRGKAVPSVWQRSSAEGFLLARTKVGSFVLSAGYRRTCRTNSTSSIIKLAGDVDGSFDVTHEDFALIRSAIADPSSFDAGGTRQCGRRRAMGSSITSICGWPAAISVRCDLDSPDHCASGNQRPNTA